jgi:putative toxin-antitoxin system antitoxin component (TIGR02293 family)
MSAFSRLEVHMTTRQERYATIFSKAVQVLGSEASAREWMGQPAIGLDQQIPATLVKTAGGAELVDTYLDQIEHGVYV